MDVVPAASPDPLSLEVGGPLRDGAAARVELAVAAAARDAVDHAGRGHRVGERRFLGGWKNKREILSVFWDFFPRAKVCAKSGK